MNDKETEETDLVPKHLDTKDPETWEKPEDTTWGDYMLRPDRPLADRHRELARLMAHGKTNQEICTALGYTPGRVSVLKSNTKIKEAAEKYRDQLFTVDTQTRLKEMESDALNVMGVDMPVEKKESAAKWVLEKTTGKAAQQIDINHEGSLGIFIEELDKIKGQGGLRPALTTTPNVIDVTGVATDTDTTPKEPEGLTSDPFDEWLDKNI